MTLPQLSINRPVFAWMLMTGLILFGGIALKRLGISQLPDVDFPTVNIYMSLEGASPEVMELEVIDPIESALGSVAGIENVSSSARTGDADITVEFRLGQDINLAVQEIQNALARVQNRLPTDADPPVVQKSNPDDQPILWLGVSSASRSQRELMVYARDHIQNAFSTIEGVGQVVLNGYFQPNLRVWLHQDKLDQYQLTASDVVSAINREHSEKPGGKLENDSREMNIRILGEAPSLNEFQNLTISRRGGQLNHIPIALKSVATIEDGTTDIRSITRTNGSPAIGVGIKKQAGGNSVAISKAIKERMKTLELPPDIDLSIRYDSVKFIEEAVHELYFTLILSAILTALVCWLFLGSLSATLNVVLAIPTSVIGSFVALYLLGFTLNTFTLLALSLAIGIVVDDAIMVLENIFRHREMGKSRKLAALEGANEIAFAALATTCAVIAIFLPVAFMDGVIGKYFFQFGVTLSVAVAISLIEALTLTPMRCAEFLNVAPRQSRIGQAIDQAFKSAEQFYRFYLEKTLRAPIKTILFSFLFFAATLFFGWALKQEFVPPEDQSRLIVRMTTPPGSSLALTDKKVKEVETLLATHPEIQSTFVNVGGGGSRSNFGFIFLSLTPKSVRKLSARALADLLRSELKKVEGIQAFVHDPSASFLGGRRSQPIQLSVQGPDWQELIDTTKKLTTAMEQSGLMTDIDSNFDEGFPELRIWPDRAQATRFGVDVAEVAKLINTMVAGQIAGKYSQNGRRYDVRVSLPNQERLTQDTISKIKVRNNAGELIPLDRVVKMKIQNGLQSISRENGNRAIQIRANVARHSSQKEAMNKLAQLKKDILPKTVTAIFAGSSKTFQDSFKGLMIALLLGVLFAYMVLASQFNSFIHPISVLMALPFSISGALIALYLGQQSLNIYSMIGIILLMGIVKKNSIMLVEFTTTLKQQGLSSYDALIKACPIRLRPILMTSIATLIGAIPPALAIGPGAESRVPMALAIIGGVILSSTLTLFVVPSSFLILERWSRTNETGHLSTGHIKQ